MTENSNQNIQKELRREAVKRNWQLFRQSRLGMIGLFIVIFFLFLALLQPFLFLTGIWEKGVYDPVVGYEPIRDTFLVVECPKEYPTDKYDSYTDCPARGEINIKSLYMAPEVQVGDYYETFVQPAPPSRRHLLGTDSLGRDIFSQIMEGSQVAFVLGPVSYTHLTLPTMS